MRLLEFVIVDALPQRRAFRAEASRHFVQARIDDAIPLAAVHCEERHEYFRHELFEPQRCVERLLRTLMIERVCEYVSQHVDARDELFWPFPGGTQTTERDRAFDASAHLQRHGQVRTCAGATKRRSIDGGLHRQRVDIGNDD